MEKETQQNKLWLRKLIDAFEAKQWKETIRYGTKLRGKGIEWHKDKNGSTPIAYYLGYSLYRLGYEHEAIVLLGSALKLQPDSPIISSTIAGLFNVTKGDDTAIRYIEREFWINELFEALNKKDWNNLINHCTKLIEMGIEFTGSLYGDMSLEYYIGYSHFRLSNYPKAIEHLESALFFQPNIMLINSALEDAFRKSGNNDKAEYYFNRALSDKPNSPKELMALFYVKILDAQYESAVSIAKSYFKIANKQDNKLNYEAVLSLSAAVCYQIGDIPGGDGFLRQINSQTFRLYNNSIEDSRAYLLSINDLRFSAEGSKSQKDSDNQLTKIVNQISDRLTRIEDNTNTNSEEPPKRPDWIAKDAKWESLRIKFIDPLNVIAYFSSSNPHKLSYNDLGFGDTRKNSKPKPCELWGKFLQFLAEGGVIYKNDKRFQHITEMDYSRIRKTLSTFFQISGKPISNYSKKNGYKALFRISIAKEMKNRIQKANNIQDLILDGDPKFMPSIFNPYENEPKDDSVY